MYLFLLPHFQPMCVIIFVVISSEQHIVGSYTSLLSLSLSSSVCLEDSISRHSSLSSGSNVLFCLSFHDVFWALVSWVCV